MGKKSKSAILLAAAFLAGVLITAVVAFAVLGSRSPSPRQEASLLPEPGGSEAAPASGQGIDFQKAFPSWNPDSAPLRSLVDFVREAADETSPN